MGSYSSLQLAGKSFFATKSSVDQTLMTIFDESNRRTYRRPVKVDYDDEPEEEEIHEYRLDPAQARRRLEVMGFTATRAKHFFKATVQSFREEFGGPGYGPYLYPIDDEEIEAFLLDYSYENWRAAFRECQIAGNNVLEAANASALPPRLRIVSTGYHDELHYGYPWTDWRLMIRAYLDASNTDKPLVLEFSELVHSGYYSGSESLATTAREVARREFTASAPIIVLTEGSTDVEFVEGSLRLLYPELSSLFSFLDFQLPKLEGGAANLVRVLKGFVGSGISNRVVGLLDNDTAAKDAMRGLTQVALPSNFVLQQFPPIDYADSYPTLGPTGLIAANVNGLAGGIELYFGRDVLSDDTGELTAVQWKGYNQTLRCYQGELVDKKRLQQQFRRKLARADLREDWTGMRAILTQLFNAFADSPLELS